MPLRSFERGYDEEGAPSYSSSSAFSVVAGSRGRSYSANMHNNNIRPSDCVVTTPSYEHDSYGPAGPTRDDFTFDVRPMPPSGISVMSDADSMMEESFDDNIILEEEENNQSRLPILKALFYKRRVCFLSIGLLATLLLGVSLGIRLGGDNSNSNDDQLGLVPISSRYLPLREALVDLMGGDTTPFASADTVHHQALLFLSEEDPRKLNADDPSLGQRFALAMMFYSTYGMTWKSKLNWMTMADECDWEGVKCDQNGFVYELVLRDHGIKGHLSDLSLLDKLERLNLEENKGLKGSAIPHSLGTMPSLREVQLSGCGLVGGIPDPLWNDHMEIIDLSNNQLVGYISPHIEKAASLSRLLLENNGMGGALPYELGSLPLLRELRLGSNNFSGPVPDLDAAVALRVLSLYSNQLTGIMPLLPKEFMQEVNLANNTMAGTIGPKLNNMPELVQLKLENNLFADDLDITLDLSHSLKLEQLHLNDNHFSSTKFPQWVAFLISLRELRLYGNSNVVGTMPTTVCDLVDFVDLKEVSVDCNHVQGCPTHCCDALGECIKEIPEEFSI